MKKTLLTIIFAISLMYAIGQQVPLDSVALKGRFSILRQSYVGLNLGSTGDGLQFAYPVAKRWDVRLTGSYLPEVSYRTNGNEGNVDYNAEYTLRTGIIGLFTDFYLSKKHTGLKAAFGIVYSFLKITGSRDFYAPTYKLDLGNLYLASEKMPVSPYLGFVWGNQASAGRLAFALEIGTFYQGSPKLDFKGSGRVAPTANESNRKTIENNVSSLRFYPYGNLQLNFRLGKKQTINKQKK